MPISRRNILSLVGAAVAAPTLGTRLAQAATPDNSPFGQRSIGAPNAPVTAIEYFSLTCTHCAYFANTVMPQVKPKLVDTGKLQIIYRDFPLDAVALQAAQVARSLPADEYYTFIEALFANQDDWAFVPVTDPNNPPDYAGLLYKYAALAGMDQTTYQAAIHNDKLKAFILQGQQDAEKQYNVNATPTFIINGKIFPGAMEYPDFARVVAQAASS
ncbi:MAG: thioredoxin domain-containing protein [Acidocella sp.]|nr:thioredoxin domain-containing protein [Acidocella sp.]